MNRLAGLGAVIVFVLAVSAGPASAAPSATLTPNNGPPGATVTVKGAGFSASSSIAVYLDTTQIALTVSSAGGVVNTPITIPINTQPGAHWITLDQLSNHTAAQAAFTIVVSWPQGGWGPSWRGFNPYENTIFPWNASELTAAWSKPVTPYGNPKPFVDLRGNLYVFDENEGLHAYSPAGNVLWTAAPGANFRFSQAAPVAYGGNVYVGDSTGKIVAYKYLCRTDGGVCTTPVWSKNIGTAVNGGLTAYGGRIYAPGADGVVHVLNAATGAIGTSIKPLVCSGAVTQPVSFGAEGLPYVVQGSCVSNGPISTTFNDGASLSAVAVGNGTGYVTGTDGTLDEEPGGWSTTIGATGCDVTPVFANNVVYGASCNTVGAYEAGSGSTIWSISISGQPQGMAFANGVLYVCWGYQLRAYDASYGGLIATIGRCTGPPEIAAGTVFTTLARLYALTLTGVLTTAPPPPPDPLLLKPQRGSSSERGAASAGPQGRARRPPG